MICIVVLDAFRHDYVDKDSMPFTYDLQAKSQHFIVEPPFGFEPDASFLSGMYPEESDNGVHFWLSPKTSHFFLFKFFGSIIDRFPSRIRKIIRISIKYYLRSNFFIPRAKRRFALPYNIPFKLIHYFDCVHKKFVFESHCFKKDSIFDYCNKNKIKYKYFGFPRVITNKNKILNRIKSIKVLDNYGLIYVFVGDLDVTGHRYGPDSIELKSKLLEIDEWVNQLFNIMNKTKKFSFIILGDHGMTNVKSKIDLISRLSSLNLTLGKDYLTFIDSTLARFWFFNKQSRLQIENLLNRITEGFIIDNSQKKLFHIDYPHTKFGELIFCLKCSYIFLPNFFQGDESVQGMHGYPNNCTDNYSKLIIYDTEIEPYSLDEDPLPMKYIYNYIINFLERYSNKI